MRLPARALSIAACLLLFALFFTLAPAASAQQVRIVHIDVGQGDATLVVGPLGRSSSTPA